jgi:hypothetical protein
MKYQKYIPQPMQSSRPNADDFRKVPSLSSGKPHTPPKAWCVGVNKFTGNAK